MKILAENVITGSQRTFKSVEDLRNWIFRHYPSATIMRRWELYRYVSDASVASMPHGIANMYDFYLYYNLNFKK